MKGVQNLGKQLAKPLVYQIDEMALFLEHRFCKIWSSNLSISVTIFSTVSVTNIQTKILTKKIFHLIAHDAVHNDQQQWTWVFFELCRKSFRHVELVKLLEKQHTVQGFLVLLQYIHQESKLLATSFGTYIRFRIYSACCSVQKLINQFKSAQQSKQQSLLKSLLS